MTSSNSTEKADRALNISAIIWFLAAVVGQWLFVYYIIIHYGGSLIQGDMETFGKPSIVGYAKGDLMGNLVFGAHVLMAAIITLGGTLQLVPQIRKHCIKLHRWNGRVFIVTAILMGIGGLYLVWVRGATLTLFGSVAITINALMMLAFSILAWKTAMAGKITEHRRWALRAFIMVNGVWFFRVGFMAWIILNKGALWSTENLDGPFDMVWAFASFLIPLAILELYLRADKRAGSKGKYAMSVGLFLVTIIMVIGIFGAFMFMWKPRL
jgi:hypothetical protein